MIKDIEPERLAQCVNDLFKNRIFKGKRVKEVRLRRSGRGYRAVVVFEDGTTTEEMLSILLENL